MNNGPERSEASKNKNFWYNLAEPEIETKMHSKIMRLTKLITVALRIANKVQFKPNKRGTNYAARFQ